LSYVVVSYNFQGFVIPYKFIFFIQIHNLFIHYIYNDRLSFGSIICFPGMGTLLYHRMHVSH